MTRNFILFLTFIPCLLSASASWKGETPGGFTVEVTLSTEKISISDHLKITALFSHPENYNVDWGNLRMNLLKYPGLSEPPFSLIEEKREILSNTQKKVTYTLEPQLEGLQFVSLYNIRFLPKNPNENKPAEIISDIFNVTITLPPTTEKFQGMSHPLLSLVRKFPISVSQKNREDLLLNPKFLEKEAQGNLKQFRQKTPPWGSLAGILLFVFTLLIIRMLPKTPPDLEKEQQRKALSAKDSAIKSLKFLKKQDLIEKDEQENFYIQLTETVRKFIEERFLLPATKQSTQEFLYDMSSHPDFDTETQAMLSDFLISADRVKFAEHHPSLEECEKARQMATQFISGV